MQDEESGGKSGRAMRSVGHGASGGHNRGRVTPNNQIHRPKFDDPEGGGSMTYQYEEYPKHITVAGVLHVVRSAAEEETLTAGETIVREEDERARLVALAEVKGVQVDKRWGISKLEKAITDAGFDATANPFA